MTTAQKVLGSWEAFHAVASPYLQPISDEEEYEAAESLLQSLVERMETPSDPRYIVLFRLLAAQIQAWEDQHQPIRELNGAELLAGLLLQHQLTQNDLADVVDQSTLSKILRGERQISKRLAKALGARFGLSAAVFL
jgi:HTH-type transcriptional regulator / antitoxin HigA